MHQFFKKLFLTIILIPLLLLADGTDIGISVSNASAVTESAGTTSFDITLTEEADWCDEVVVNYSTQDSSALAGSDYTASSGTTTFYGACLFPPRFGSSATQTVSVNINNDATHESTELFRLNISNATVGYVVTNASGSALIYDDDTAPLTITSYSTSVSENDGTAQASFLLYLNQVAPTGGVSIPYQTRDNSALAGTDYIAQNSSITIPQGQTYVYIQIPIIGDTNIELQESFYLDFGTPSQGTLNNTSVTGTINDDDQVQVDISSTDVIEGNIGDNNQMEFKIFLTKDYPLSSPLIIDYTTQDGSAPSATANTDYTLTSGSVTFNQGDREKIIYVPIIGDNDIETDENLKMIISGSSYIVDNESESEIINDDGSYPGIDFSTGDFSITEGNSSTKILNFHFSLDADAVLGTSFDYHTQDDEATVADNDYVAVNSTYTIPVGTRDIDIPITINGDSKIENNELFQLKITNEKHVTVHGHTAKGNILNDDGSFPELSFNLESYDITEGHSGSKDINFSLSLDQPALAGSSFKYYTANNTAQTSDNDYTAIPTKTHTFNGGETTFSILVSVNGDTNVESDEAFYLYIFDAQDIKLNASNISAKGKILNDDHPPVIINNVGEFRFDDCGNDEWKKDHSSVQNHILNGTPSIVENDGKSYMCSSINGLTGAATIPHHANYEINEGTFSMLLYDHHNVWSSNSWMFQKGGFNVEVVRVSGDSNQGSVKVSLDGNVIDTQEVFLTNSDGDDFDTQWIHVAISFGSSGMKLYINGIEKGSNAHTAGISTIQDDITLATLSGYFDEFYIFDGQMSDMQVNNLYNNTINNINIDGTTRDCGCYTSSDPFTCDNSMYISSSTNRETSATGRMWLHSINTATNPFEFEVMDATGATELYNATAYNPDDNYIYGLYQRELIRLSRGAEVTSLGTVSDLPIRFETKQLYAGAIHNGYYYTTGRNSKMRELYSIKLSDLSVTELNLSEEIAIQDFSFYKNVNDGIAEGIYLYGIEKDGPLIQIDVRDGSVTKIGADHTGYEFDSSFSDKNGRFFANDSNGNGFFEFSLATGVKNLVSNSQPATFNDGANCINAALVFNDYGDAPSSYGIPKHNLANGIFMGENIDHDIYAFDTINADGDDINGIDDEDGVTLADGTDLNGEALAINTLHDLNIKVSKNGYLNAWIDYNVDGDFNDAGEKIFTAYALTTGTHTLSLNIPDALPTNQDTYIRFRYSSTANLDATQNSNDGEVEDYMIRFKSNGLRGAFNIERTNSHLSTLGSDARHAWYTQIVGRDFDYSLVFYDEDFSAEKNISNVTVHIDLMDEETNSSIHQYSFHIPDTVSQSKIDITQPVNDLASLPATKRARFKVTYGVSASGEIIQANCLSTPALCALSRPNDAKDNFAIRPEKFYMSIADHSDIRKENTNMLNDPLRIAAGYEYNLSIIAGMYNANTTAAMGYDASVARDLEFRTIGNCADEANETKNIDFNNGHFNDSNFSHNNVGTYLLTLKDSSWSEVDSNKAIPECQVNQATSSGNGNLLSGCNISTVSDINLSFYPYQFDVNFNMNNLPDSGHNDFIYMSEVNGSDHNVSLQFLGTITAQNKDHSTTTNFTQGCVAQDVQLQTNTITLSDNGYITPIQTSTHPTEARENVNIARMARFNDEALSPSTFDHITNISSSPLNIAKEKFIDEQNGTVHIDLRYNIQKHLSRTINPVQILFENLIARSPLSASTTEGKISPNYIPEGNQEINASRNFYFSRVASDKRNYPTIYFGDTNIIRTPLNIDIFCDKNISYCQETKVLEFTDKQALSKVQNGWYPSTEHNTLLDGNVTALTSPTVEVTVVPNSNIDFTNGRNGTIINEFNNCINTKVTVIIVPQVALLYDVNSSNNGYPNYNISCTNSKAGSISGIGKTGKIIKSEGNNSNAHKISW